MCSFVNFRNLFKGKRVLVTGDSGFKGSWLSFWLHELGANVVGLSLPPNNAKDHYCAINLEALIHHISCDIRELNDVADVFQNFQPEFLFHLAAQPLVRESYINPVKTYQTNVLGTLNLLEGLRLLEKSCTAVLITSDKSYKNVEWVWGYRENDALGGPDPYSASKGAAEMVISSHVKSFFPKNGNVRIAVGRAGNVIGGGDWANDRIIPDCVRSWSKEKSVLLRNPQSIRPWQHVLEPISGMLWLSTKMYQGEKSMDEAWNLGPDNSNKFFSVKDIVELILSRWKCKSGIKIINNMDEPFESKILQIDPSKANDILEWKNVYSVEEAITETVSWYKTFIEDPEIIEKATRCLGLLIVYQPRGTSRPINQTYLEPSLLE